MTTLQTKKQPKIYKGFTINFIRGEYRAEAYLYEPIYNTNLTNLKKQIREVLNNQ